MTTGARATLIGALLCSPIVLLTGCGDSGSASGSRATLQFEQGTSYVTIEPATTTTTTTIPQNEIEEGAISPTEQTYTIQSGDNLFRISGLFDIEAEVICNYNGWADCIDPPHLLLPGDDILIPPNALVPGQESGGTTTDETDSIDEVEETEDEGVGCVHTIVEGDNPTRVANQYDITVDELSNANLSNPAYNTFLIGATLNIPSNGNC
jgi:hypothetical protein